MFSFLLPVIYLAFISLGLPDALLGAAWPSMYQPLGADLSWAGAVSMIISAGTIVSSLASDRLNSRLGTGKVTAGSVALPPLRCSAFPPARRSGSCAFGPFPTVWAPAVWMRPSITMWRCITKAAT